MAAKRISKSAIDWVAFAERVPKNQKQQFQTFKSKSDTYLRKVLSLPENPPAIDWALYKKAVSPALVEQFEKQYAALKVPHPTESVSPQIDEQEKAVNKSTAEFISLSKERIAAQEKELERWTNMLPFEQMTMEDLKDVLPELVFDRNKPQLWPPGIENLKREPKAH